MFETILLILTYVFWGTGAAISWLIKGCRTSFKDEFSKKYENRIGIIAASLLII
jgi:hypothetical protein